MIDRFETFTFAISEISHCWNKIAAEEMEKYGLKAAYAFYLVALYKHDEGITAANLCELCNKDKAEISRSVSFLEKKGLCVRENVGENSYRALIKLTKEGKKAAEYVKNRAEIAVCTAGSGITEEERTVFYKALCAIASNLKAITKEGLEKSSR